MKKINHTPKINLPLIAIVIGLSISVFIIGKGSISLPSTEASSSACKCTDPDICYPDGCTRKPKTDDNTFDEARYDHVCEQFLPSWPPSAEYQRYYCGEHQPDCCADMVRYQDSRLCCFMERWHCNPNYCDQLDDPGDCGKYWGDGSGLAYRPEGYGCVQGQDLHAKYGVAPNTPPGDYPTGNSNNPTTPPTATPTRRPQQQPTATAPTAVPTIPITVPTALPTQPPKPTSSAGEPVFGFPTSAPDPNPSPTITSSTGTGLQLTFPQFTVPVLSIKKHIDTVKVEEQANKALVIPKQGFQKVKEVDTQLETTVNSWLLNIWRLIFH